MADLRIVDAPEIPTNSITGQEKIPTGGSGNYSISLDSLADYTKTKKDLVDNTSVDNKVNGVRQELNTHTEDSTNPHQVTKGQIGLGNVDNTADADKPVSNSTQAAIISAVAQKADKTYVDSQLTLKANKADVDSSLLTKADKTYTDNQLALKADKTYVDSQDSSLQSQINQKATAEYLDNALTEQTNTVNTALSNLSTSASKFYPTLAEANADIANIEVNQPIQVGESGGNGGLWYKATAGATTLTKSDYDPLTQAKLYTDSFFTYYGAASLLTVKNYFVLSSNGAAASNASFDCSDFIPVVESETYNIYSQIIGTASHAWYDKDKVFISSFGTDQTTLAVKSYVAPTNARYVRISAYNTTARASAYLSSKSYVINKVKEIIRQHAPNIDAGKVIYGSSDVNATLDSVINKQNTIIVNQNGIVGQLDLMTDKESPYFVNTSQFVKAVRTPTNFDVVNVTARESDTQMTVSDATAFIYSGSCVVHDPTANSYTSHNVIGINGTTITVMPPLPANPTQAQTMHDAALGQHLTLFGYKGLADFAVNSIQKYSYKKSENLVFNFNPTKFVHQTSNQGQITTDGTTVAIPVTLLGTAKSGGYVSGTTNLIKACDLPSSSYNIGQNAHTQYLSKAYQLIDAIAGNGFEIIFDAQSSDGFIEIPLAVRDELYTSSIDSQQYRTSGKARLQVFNGSTSIHDAAYAAGQVHHVFIDFIAAETIKVRITCETATPTWAALSGIFAYKKSANTSKTSIFNDGDVVAFLGDSWTQYPIASTIGETGQTRPDGSVSTGSQWLSRRMKEKLLAQGKNVTMLNMGFGGQTSRWGKYWVNTIIALEPKPTHCILCFYINDNNGINNSSATAYDFDPDSMFVNKTVANGGVDGRVRTYDEWEANMKWLCEKLSANGIKPIVIMPSQTASASQAQAIRSGELDRLADGFD